MQLFNLFRCRRRNGLMCAVPEERAVPAFVTAQGWEFGGKLDGSAAPPLGFDPKAAAAGVRFNGFYLFAAFERGGGG